MTLSRATLYIGGATLLAAWFASAASVSLGRNPRQAPRIDPAATVPAQALTASVQAQARRLKERLAAAPTPQQPVRNPFAFRPVPQVRTAPVVRQAVAAPEPVSPEPQIVEPPLALIGVAERREGEAPVRSAVLTSDGLELIMAEVGAVVLGRYKVTAIDADAVEMQDTATGRPRRLTLPVR